MPNEHIHTYAHDATRSLTHRASMSAKRSLAGCSTRRKASHSSFRPGEKPCAAARRRSRAAICSVVSAAADEDDEEPA